MFKSKSILYVNYFPYENSGFILDYLKENFEFVYVIIFGFHSLGNASGVNKLSVFRNGKLDYERKLFQIVVPKSLVFIFLPIKSFVNFIQIATSIYWLRSKYKKIDIYFSVNAFTAWIGNIMKGLGFINKTVFWVWDYYPPIHQSKVITIMRQIYWQFDRIASYSDKVVFVNKRLMQLRRDMGIFIRSSGTSIVPIGSTYRNLSNQSKKTLTLGFVGVLKKGQGLDVIFDNNIEVKKLFPYVNLQIIGAGPDELYYRKRAAQSQIPTKFYGYIPEGKLFDSIIEKFTIGLATYTPDPSNVSYFGDPGKIKMYLSYGIPVIITNIFEFSTTIAKYKAGIIIDPKSTKELLSAIADISKKRNIYRKNALNLNKKYYYKNIYRGLF